MANTTEEGKVTVTYIGDVPTFTVKIKDFESKMKTWPSGKLINSESFTFLDVPLSLKIYPNGIYDDDDGIDEGNVSVFLKNNDGGNIQVDYTLKMKGKTANYFKVDFIPSQALGSTALYCHKGVAKIGSDDDTKISCTIRNLKKNVSNITLANSIETIQSSNEQLKSQMKNGTNGLKNELKNDLKRKYDSMESKVEEGNSNVEKRIARLESKLEASCESIKAKIDATKNNNVAVVKPKCPICFEEMSTKIAQCLSGHFLCWPCKEKMGDKDCAFCDQPVNGRAFGMEAYLRTIFG